MEPKAETTKSETGEERTRTHPGLECPGTRTGRAARWRVLERVLTEYERLLLKREEYERELLIDDQNVVGGYDR